MLCSKVKKIIFYANYYIGLLLIKWLLDLTGKEIFFLYNDARCTIKDVLIQGKHPVFLNERIN
jgi:hypothetical protein